MKSIKLLFVLVILFQTTVLSADELKFRLADGLALFIFDNNSSPDGNRILSRFHNTEYIINGDGYILLGSLGKVKIVGLTVEQATEVLYEKFEKYGKNLTIIVEPMIRVILRGEFGQAGMYRFNPSSSIWDVIAKAGGMSSSFAMDNMYIIRRDDILYKNFKDALYVGTSLAEIGIESGDEIVAPRVNRISFNSVMRYVNFGASLILLYYAIGDESR